MSTLLDEETPPQDPLAGTSIGSCEVVGNLIPGKTTSALLAFKLDLVGANSATVLLHRLEDGAIAPSAVADAEEAVGLHDTHLERVYGLESSAQGTHWVTEYVPGATLDEVRTVCKQKGMNLPMGFGLAAVADALLGLQQLHAKQNARDPLRPRAHGLIRPQHIVVTFSGGAKLLNPRYLKRQTNAPVDSEWFAGNAGYLAPEAIRGETVDPRSDVFSLAVLVHELLTNKILFSGRTPHERADATMRGAQVGPSKLNFSLNAAVDEPVMKALSLEPAHRYANAGDFHRALRSAVGPYMWKEGQRAEYMERLFPTRSRRTKELNALMKEREGAARLRIEEEKRAVEAAAAAEVAAKAAAEAAARAAQQQAAEAARRAAEEAAASASRPPTAVKSAARPGAAPAGPPIPLIAGGAGGVVLLIGAIAYFATRSPPPPPLPPVVVQVVDAGVADAGTADAGSDADAGEADAGEADAGDADAGVKKKPKVKPKGPELPPWLRK